MNRIYKVVWSKAKHCYVVTSELAKQQTKGCGARSLRMAAVSMGVAAALLSIGGHWLLGPSVAYAAGASDNTFTVTTDKTKTVYGGIAGGSDPGADYRGGWSSNNADNANNNNLTIVSGMVSYAVGGSSEAGEAINNVVTVNSGTVDRLRGGYSSGIFESVDGKANDNTVIINNGTVKEVYGGTVTYGFVNTNHVYMDNGAVNYVVGGYGGKSASYNEVVISGGTVDNNTGEDSAITGGLVASTEAKGNTVTIKGTAKVTGDVWGASSWYSDAVITDNTVTIKGSAIVTGNVTGGLGMDNYDKKNNAVNVEENAQVTGNVYGGSISKEAYWEPYDGNADANTVSIKGGTVNGNVYGGSVTGNSTRNAVDNKVSITGGTVTGSMFGGAVTDEAEGSANSNKVEISGASTKVHTVYGGYAEKAPATKNTVTIAGGETGNVIGGIVTGSTVVGGEGGAKENVVNVTGGKVEGTVFGGFHPGGKADVTGNVVTISGEDTEVKGEVGGGVIEAGAGNITGNIVNIQGGNLKSDVYGGASDGTGDVTKNKVNYTGGTVSHVYGGLSSAGKVTDNEVTIDGGALSSTVYGGYGYNGVVTGNTVTMTAGQVNSSVYGGVSETKTASSNTVKVSGGKVTSGVIGGRSGKDYGDGHPAVEDVKGNKVEISGDAEVTSAVYGGMVTNATANAEDNTVTIKDTSKVNRGIHGGQTNYGNAIHNKVTIEGGTITGYSYGDYVTGGRVSSDNNGKALNNEVEISGGTISITVQGGFAQGGETAGNKVTISGGTVTGTVEGAYNTGNVMNNSVTITGGKLSNRVAGGRGNGSATGNTVTISGGTDSWIIMGGYGMSGATGNTVTISGGNLTVTQDRARPIYGGYTDFYYDSPRDATGNTVNLTGNTTGLETRNLVGGYDYNGGSGDVVSGNELHVGGTKDGSVTGAWQGSGGNTLNEVRNFDSIVLHAIDWSSAAAALNVATLANVNTLDVSKLDFSAATDGKILLTAGNEFSTGNSNAVSLAYKDKGTDKTATFAALSAGVTFDVVGGGTDVLYNKNGVKVLGSGSKTIKLADVNSIMFNITSSPTGIEFGNMTYGTGADLTSYTLTSGATLDATNLKFNDPEKAKGFMALLSGATGIVADMAVTAANHTQDFTNTLSNNVTLSATLEGTVATLAGSVNYTVKDTTVKNVDLTNWNGKGAAVTGGWKSVDGGLAVTAAGFTDPTLAAGQTSQDIVTTDTEGFFSSVTGDKAYQGSNLDLDAGNGVSVKGVQASGVKAEDNGKKLTYYASVKDVNSIDVSGWDGTKATVVDLTGWNLADGIAVDTDGMAVPATMASGDSVTLLQATGANFTGIAVTGAYAWQEEGSLDTAPVNGVSVTGTSTGGGVKGDGTKIIYQKSKNAIASLTLGKVAFADNGTARSFGADDDLSAATINADSLSFSNASSMKGGQRMTLVDATGALNTATIAAFADKKYETKFADNVTDNLTIKGAQTDWLKQDGGTKLVYTVGDRVASNAGMSGDVAWSDGATHYTNEAYKFDGNTKVNVGVNFTATADPLAGATKTMTLIKDATGVVASNVTGTPTFTVALDQANTTLSGSASGTAGLSADSKDVTYTVNGVQLQTVTVNSAGDTADTVPVGWTIADGATVETDGMAVPDVAAGESKPIITGSDGFFAKTTINGKNAYETNVTDINVSDETSAVTIKGTQKQGVTKDDTNTSIVYKVGYKDVSSIKIATVTWQDDGNLLDGSNADYSYANAAYDTDGFTLTNPEVAAANQSMTLLQANATLADMAAQTKSTDFSVTPVSGVTVNGAVTGNLASADNKVTFTTTANQASELKFEKVEWTGDNPLLDHSETLKNISFDGATVDTSNIDFYKEMYIEAGQTTNLVSGFGGEPGEIKGSKYMVGTAFEGEGSATMENGNLIFRTKTAAGVSEQTHKAVMGVEATMSLLATGREHAGKVLDGLGNLSNVGSDGTSVAASIGGGKDRYETGSHVNVNSWSAAVGVGARKEMKKGTLQYGIFGEYGKGNYTLHSDVGRSDGDAHYAGGGLMAKWTNKHDVYTEASFRLGRVSDSANDLLRDGAGNAYGYDIHATYYGAHVGLGKVFNYKGGKSLDVYGKFFYTKRDGAEFDAKQHYDLDSVSSSVLRIGARYGTTDKKWNWYGGLAYEYEFDGESKGTVNGTAIRAASIKGSSVRGEFGMRMDATKDNPWQADISIYGYGGKHRGFGGSVNVAYTF